MTRITTSSLRTSDRADGLVAFRRRCQQFALAHIAPVAALHDENATYPAAVAEAARAAGLLYPALPKDLGGPEHTCEEEVLLAEAFGYHCTGIWSALALPGVALLPLVAAMATDHLRMLSDAARDGRLATISPAEPTSGSHVSALHLTARRQGDVFVLSGVKHRVPLASTAAFLLVLARTYRSRQASLFLVPADTPGMRVEAPLGKCGHRAYSTASVQFDDVVLGEEYLIGAGGAGFALVEQALRRYRVAAAAAATALATRALDIAVSFTTRPSTTGVPLREHRMIRDRLADLAVGVEASSALVRLSAVRVSSFACDDSVVTKAKVFATDWAMRAAATAVEISDAGLGMSGNPVGKLLRDAQVLASSDGMNRVGRDSIARSVLTTRDVTEPLPRCAAEPDLRSRLERIEQAVAASQTVPLRAPLPGGVVTP